MKKARVSIIAAVGKNRELGHQNELIWRIPADLGRVKKLTTGHPIIMGKNTYLSIGKPLPNRTNIVLSFEQEEIPECIVCTSLEDALAHAHSIDDEEIFIFGGAQIYTQALPDVERLYLTLIHDTAKADAFFPDYSDFTKVISEETDKHEDISYSWLTLERAQ